MLLARACRAAASRAGRARHASSAAFEIELARARRLVLAVASNARGGAGGLEDLALAYGLSPTRSAAAQLARVRPLAVVKVGGEVIMKDADNLVQSLRSLLSLGLFPVVVHGGGPQLNDELARLGVQPEYIGGHRVTDATTMAIARRVFEAANGQLAAALEAAGIRTRPFLGGVFGAEVGDARLGLVGEVNNVVHAEVFGAIAEGRVPVLTSLGVNRAGETLNINADVAARELAVALRPLRVVFISAGGGWREDGKVVADINMARDFERMAARDYTGRQGTLLKLREVKQITDALPAAASVTIASAAALAESLVPHKGPGTQFRRGQRLQRFGSVGACDVHRLVSLLLACGAAEAHVAALLGSAVGPAAAAAAAGAGPAGPVVAIYATDEYSACAIVTKPPASSSSSASPPLPLLHTMACLPLAIAEGAEASLWSALRDDFPALAWRAPASRDTAAACAEVEAQGLAFVPLAFPALSVNRSARHAAGGAIPLPGASGAVAMWYGAGHAQAAAIVEGVMAATALPAPAPISASPSAAAPQPPSPSAIAPAPAPAQSRDVRVGLLGARGFVGRELLRLLARHPRLQVTCASSRALAGSGVADALGVPEAAAACAPGLSFVDVGPAQLRSGSHAAVDVWVLALPNGLAAAHAEAIEARAREVGAPAPLLVDLSADMRFDACAPGGGWVYGLPERKGARALLRAARRIANPGCYATGAQAALMPLLAGAGAGAGADAGAGAGWRWDARHKPHVFGVSGYSGAGTSPSDKNDPARLRDNLLPYALTSHLHEREIALHCGLGAGGVAFMPHVAPFFQGISLTVTGHVAPARDGGALPSAAQLQRVFEDFYAGERLVRVLPAGATPDVRAHEQGDLAHGVTVGGHSYDAATGRLALVACIDNLLKGAATQCLQNINLALQLGEYEGIPVPPKA